MRLPIIKLRDNCTGDEFVMTDSNPHNYLYADGNGIQFYNLQNGEGIGDYTDSGYRFVGEKGYMGTDIPMVDMADILLMYCDIKIKPLQDKELETVFSKILDGFKALDICVEDRAAEHDEAFRKKFIEYAMEYFEEDSDD